MDKKQVKKDPDSVLSLMAKQCLEDSEDWFGDSAVVHSIPHHSLALAGEVGEFANLVKKIERGSLKMGDAAVRYQLAMELTDVLVYVLNLSALLGVDLEKSYMMVRANNKRRFTEERDARTKANGR